MIKPYEPLYTIKEVSKILKTSVDAVYTLTRNGQLPSLTLGSKKVRGTDLEKFIEKYPVDQPEQMKEV